MISEHLAAALREAGLRWEPTAGDRFVIPKPELAGEVFTLSEMTIEARHYASGTILGFNGTTEWALDSVAQDEALWMPREDQLRALLGGTFVALRRVEQGFTVTTEGPGGLREFTEAAAPDAYAQALLALMLFATADSASGSSA